ncbi:hypothetical protein FQN54_002796 [Arachnomyces sp. PD_36]|nr:hypothetical protein FQN54_002796 [Arachnomyces sp. PD_36]
MEGFDTMTMNYLASPLNLGNIQNTDYLNQVPGMDIPEQRPGYETEPFVSGDDIGFAHQAMSNAAMKPFPNGFEDPFAEMMTQFEPVPTENHPPEAPSIDHNNKLLSFSPPHYNFTLLDYSLMRAHLTWSAQLHGMFFLAESPWTTSPGGTAPPPPPMMAELTCYRRNLFQITGSLTIPRTLRYIMTDQGDRIPIIAQELTVSAVESVEGNPVKIISVPWKTSAANPPQPEDKVEKEPPSIPLDTMTGQELDSDFATFSIAWKRLQFRIATANNGRRKELQQHFTVKLKLIATLSTGGKVPIAEVHSGPVIVRGRSPRNFQSRKDLPLSGSAASSRKHTQQTHAAANRAAAANETATAKKEKTPVEAHQPPFQFDNSSPPNQISPTFTDWTHMTQPHSAAPLATPTFQNAGVGGLPNVVYPQSTQDVSRQNNNNSVKSNNTPRRPTESAAAPIPLSLTEDDFKPTPKSADSSTKAKRANPSPTLPSSTGTATLPSTTTAPAVSIHRDADQPAAKARKMSQTSSTKNFPQGRRQRSISSTLTIPNKQQPSFLQTQHSPHFSTPVFISPNESTDFLYEYFPLGLDDWQAPVDAVYRPHVVHHTNLPVDPKALAAKSRGKRYFADVS